MSGSLAKLARRLARFGRAEGGGSTIEFVLMIPLMFGVLLLTLDTGFSAMRAGLMDRAMEITARSIRTGTMTSPTLANIRTDLCSRLTFFPNCGSMLKVQIVSVDRASFALPAPDAACADSGAALAPVRRYVAGQMNGVVVLRACMNVPTFTPAALIGRPATYNLQASTVIAGSAS